MVWMKKSHFGNWPSMRALFRSKVAWLCRMFSAPAIWACNMGQ